MNSDATCTIAIGHHPRFSSGEHGSNATVATLHRILYDHDVELFLTAHDHNYERFKLQRPDGTVASDGVRQFVIGNGGKNLRAFGAIAPNSQVRNNTHYGIVAFRLRPAGYSFEFIATGGGIKDSGKGACH